MSKTSTHDWRLANIRVHSTAQDAWRAFFRCKPRHRRCMFITIMWANPWAFRCLCRNIVLAFRCLQLIMDKSYLYISSIAHAVWVHVQVAGFDKRYHNTFRHQLVQVRSSIATLRFRFIILLGLSIINRGSARHTKSWQKSRIRDTSRLAAKFMKIWIDTVKENIQKQL